MTTADDREVTLHDQIDRLVDEDPIALRDLAWQLLRERDEARQAPAWAAYLTVRDDAALRRYAEDLAAHVRRLEAERDEARALAVTCSCGTSPETYEGPEADCAVHGAVRAFNLVTEELAQAHADMANMQSAHTRTIVDLAVKEMQACERAATAEEAARRLTVELDEARAERDRRNGADDWRCRRCGSFRWVAASLTGPVGHGGRAIKQCVPCGHYSSDPVAESAAEAEVSNVD